MPAEPPPPWLALDTRTAIRILRRIERDGAAKVWREEWGRWSVDAAALRQWRLDHGIDDGVRPADYATWLYAGEQEHIIERWVLLYPTDPLTPGLLRAMGGLRLIEDNYPSARSEAIEAELDTASIEVELKPLTQSEPDPGLAQTELDAALVEIAPDRVQVEAEPVRERAEAAHGLMDAELDALAGARQEPDPVQIEAAVDPDKPKRQRKPWNGIDPLIDEFMVQLGTPDKKERRHLIRFAEGELAKRGLRAARSTVERHVDKRIAERKEELS
jgi:hypothetical protein